MKKLLTCLAMILVSSVAIAETEPFNLSLTPDVSVYGRGARIEGVTLSVWGENEQSSLALGIVNGFTGKSVGVSLGLLNYADNYTGLQWGLVNYVKQDSMGWGGGFFGFMISAVNYTGGTMKGFYTGVVNYSGNLTGLQLGLINYVDDADSGVQVGLINIIHQNKSWFSGLPSELAPGMILVNWRF
ncbi:MAG: hypothetical protein A2X49_13330 [Lentisphaerae bacterium GWF2_52_8]|nr:MAG: hypothetical protein A2X49_13330 [Lentisphaerae bacterium GWF2_52_8]